MNRWIAFRQPRRGIRRNQGLCISDRTMRQAFAPQKGQSLTEFAIVVPVLILLVLAIIAFGILYEDQIAMNNAARDGVRWATQNPDAWDNTAAPASNSIQGQIQGEGGTVTIPNDDQHIKISYLTVTYDTNATSPTYGSPAQSTSTSPNPQLCGSYNAASDTLVYPTGSTPASDPAHPSSGTFANSSGCLTPGNLIQVTVSQTFPIPVPIISHIFPLGITIGATATMSEEGYP